MTQLTVLDRGFVRLIDEPNSDLKVVNAARVSFGKISQWGPEGKLTERDARLLRYLAEHNHWTPFGHCRELRRIRKSPAAENFVLWLLNKGGAFVAPCGDDYYYSYSWAHTLNEPGFIVGEPLLPNQWSNQVPVTLHIKMPIFVARQLMRSNVGIVYNEISRRYVDDPPEFHEPTVWRGRPDGSIKQGSGSATVKVWDYKPMVQDAAVTYTHFINRGVSPEQARMVLPLSTYTEVWMTATTEALRRVLSLRLDPHAQWEVRQYAEAISSLTGIDPNG